MSTPNSQANNGPMLAGRPGSALLLAAMFAAVRLQGAAWIGEPKAPKQLTKYDEERLEAARRKRARRAAKKSPNAPGEPRRTDQ